MKAVVTSGIGGYDRLEYRDVPIPVPKRDEVLLQVLAAGVNNTEINTRVGWYTPDVTEGTAAAVRATGLKVSGQPVSGWSGATPFPLVQGTDCCGRVVEVASLDQPHKIGARVLVRPCMRVRGGSPTDSAWMGSDFDGSFAQFVKVPISEIFPVSCDWSDAELGSMPCAYGTAENLLLHARLVKGERVLISGASGGVGTAALQLAKLRGAMVTAMATTSKGGALRSLGADQVIDRDANIVAAVGQNAFDLVIDNVAGPAFQEMLRVLRPGGRLVTSGAIAGPLVTLDLRTLYLKDLTLVGCTAWDEAVFPRLSTYIERGEIRPLVAKTFPLARIADAQREFLEKKHIGKLVLIPPLGPAHRIMP